MFPKDHHYFSQEKERKSDDLGVWYQQDWWTSRSQHLYLQKNNNYNYFLMTMDLRELWDTGQELLQPSGTQALNMVA